MANLISQDSANREMVRHVGPWQRFFLVRLRRLVTLRREHAPLVQSGDQNLRLLDRSLYATFCDCLDLGVGEEARVLVRQGENGEVEGAAPN